MGLEAQNPCPTPKIDKDKIRKILDKPTKRLVTVDPAHQSTSSDPLNLKRLPTRPLLYNPPAKMPKFRICNPVKPTQHSTVPSPNTAKSSGQIMPKPVSSSIKDTGESSATTPKLAVKSKRCSQATLDKFVQKLRPNNVYKPALQHVQQEMHEVDKLINKMGIVEQDLQLSESSEDEDDDPELKVAAAALEKAILNMD